MTLEEYRAISARTAPTDLCDSLRRENAGLGIVGEFGEVVDLLKKMRFQGHVPRPGHLVEEFGDCLWYAAEIATVLGCDLEAHTRPTTDPTVINVACGVAFLALGLQVRTARPADLHYVVSDLVHLIHEPGFALDEVLDANVAKLRARYPAGFSVEASINRETS